MLTNHHTYLKYISWPLCPTNKTTLIEETDSKCLLNHRIFLKDILKIIRLNIVGLEQSTGDM